MAWIANRGGLSSRPMLEVAPGHVNEPEPPVERQFSPLCAHWLNWRTGLDLGAAREKLRVAAALADLNHISAARPFTEARLLAVACGATAEQVERLVRGWRGVDREAAAAGEDGAQMCLARRGLSLRVDEDGMVVLRGRLLPEVGAVVLRALEAALEQVPAAPADGTPARGGVAAAHETASETTPAAPELAAEIQVTRSSDPTLRAAGGVPGRLPGRYR